MTALPRICILTETYYPVIGGGEIQARALAEGLVAKDFEVMIITRRSDATFRKTEQYGEITVYRLAPSGHQHLKKWGLLLTSFVALIRLRRQYDLIFVSGYRVLGIAAVFVSKLFGKPCILKADSLGEMSGDFFAAGLARAGLRPSSWLFRPFLWLRNRILIHADAYVAISSAVAADLTAHGVVPATITMIPNSVDSCRFSPVTPQEKQALRSRLRLPSEDRIVVYTGRLVSYKGLPLLLRVWKAIQERHSHVLLLLVGSGGLDIHNCEAELRACVDADGLLETVYFTGIVDNVHEYLQASDIFVLPTEDEAFGISLIEAMACGLPAISTSVGGVKDILEHESNGLLVQPGEFQQLFEALAAILTDTALATRLGTAARHAVHDRYAVELVSRQYAALFTEVTNSSNRYAHH